MVFAIHRIQADTLLIGLMPFGERGRRDRFDV